jgi:hypothetical protein
MNSAKRYVNVGAYAKAAQQGNAVNVRSGGDLQLVRRGALQNQRMRILSSYSYSLNSALCTLNLVIHQDLLVISRAACSAFFAIIRRADLSKPLFTR